MRQDLLRICGGTKLGQLEDTRNGTWSQMSTGITLIFSWLSSAAIISLAALGFVLVFRTSGLVNFAQGDLITMAGFVAVYFTADDKLGWPWYVGYAVTLLVMMLVGACLDQIASATLRGKSTYTAVIATMGAAIIIRTLLAITLGGDARRLKSPLRGKLFTLGGANIAYLRVVLIVGAGLALLAVHLFLKKSGTGRQFRAMASDREIAKLYGVPIRRRSATAWAVAAALAGLAALLAVPLTSVDPTDGFALMLAGFAAAILGGYGNISGILVGALCIAFAQEVFGAYVGTNYREAYPFILMILVIAVKPEGLLRTESSKRL
jgi:branched-chain amino acid transport system permease protein